jgi:hypothetical protein
VTSHAEVIPRRHDNLTLAEVAMRFRKSPLREMCAAAGRRGQAGDS